MFLHQYSFWQIHEEKKDQLTTYDAENIVWPRIEKVMDDITKKIQEEKDQDIRKQEEEAMKHYMSHFSLNG